MNLWKRFWRWKRNDAYWEQSDRLVDAAVQAVLKCLWWWGWYGIVSQIMGTWEGFLLVLAITFTVKLAEAEEKPRTTGGKG